MNVQKQLRINAFVARMNNLTENTQKIRTDIINHHNAIMASIQETINRNRLVRNGQTFEVVVDAVEDTVTEEEGVIVVAVEDIVNEEEGVIIDAVEDIVARNAYHEQFFRFRLRCKLWIRADPENGRFI